LVEVLAVLDDLLVVLVDVLVVLIDVLLVLVELLVEVLVEMWVGALVCWFGVLVLGWCLGVLPSRLDSQVALVELWALGCHRRVFLFSGKVFQWCHGLLFFPLHAIPCDPDVEELFALRVGCQGYGARMFSFTGSIHHLLGIRLLARCMFIHFPGAAFA